MMTAGDNSTDLANESAVRIWTRRHSGGWSDADEAHLQRWLAATPENRQAYEKIARVWTALGNLEGKVPRLAQPARHREKHSLRWVAAAVILLAAGPLWLVSNNWWNGEPTTYTAQRGGTRSILLADGTQVALDADSEIEARIGARARHVTLRRGEALLTVTHDASRPLEVKVGNGRITDLGTRFDVENLDGQARVAVLEGRVGIETSRGRMLLEAGRAGGYDNDGALLPNSDADRSIALWQDGQRHFNAERLSDVLERLKRYHAVTFLLTDPRLQDLRVSGTFRTGDLQLFMNTLRAALPIDVQWTDSEHVAIGLRAPQGEAATR
jgi:transmembrane sensor